MKVPTARLAGMALLLVCASGFGQGAADGERADRVKQAVQLVSQHAYNASKVDWEKAQATALEILASDNSADGLNASIQYLISKLDDGHSSFRPAPAPGAKGAPAGGGMPPLRLPLPIGERVDGAGRFPVIRVNAWGGGDPAQVRSAAASLRQTLNQSLEDDTCGLVVDFSGNTGGNMWPMLAGLLPIFSEGLLGAFEGADGKRTSIVSSGNSLALGGKSHYLNAPRLPLPRFQPAHVAVLVGPRTASSGEIVALLLAAQANVRTFGAATAGRSSANQAFPLSDGSALILTTAATIDREGQKYWDPIAPDVPAEHAAQAAAEWLSAQCD